MDLSRKKSYYRSKSMKSPSCTRIPVRPVWPVRPTGQTGRRFAGSEIGPTSQTAYGHRSDRFANFGRQHLGPCPLASGCTGRWPTGAQLLGDSELVATKQGKNGFF